MARQQQQQQRQLQQQQHATCHRQPAKVIDNWGQDTRQGKKVGKLQGSPNQWVYAMLQQHVAAVTATAMLVAVVNRSDLKLLHFSHVCVTYL